MSAFDQVRNAVAVADPDVPANVIKPNANGSINTFASAPAGYETVAPNATDQVLGGSGAVGDVIAALVFVVATAATSTVSIKDGSGSSIPVLPANTPIGSYSIALNIASSAGAWSVTTGAGVWVIASGSFSA